MRFNTFEEMDRMFEQMRAAWDRPDLWTADSGRGADLIERDDEYTFVVDAPGFERDEFDLRFADGTLSVTAEHDHDDDRAIHRRRLQKHVRLPGAVDEDAISARYHNGVLEVHLPRTDDGDAGYDIEVE